MLTKVLKGKKKKNSKQGFSEGKITVWSYQRIERYLANAVDTKFCADFSQKKKAHVSVKMLIIA